jgi:hypothetical protein
MKSQARQENHPKIAQEIETVPLRRFSELFTHTFAMAHVWHRHPLIHAVYLS